MKQLFLSLLATIALSTALAEGSHDGGHGGHAPGGSASEHFMMHCAQCHGVNGISKLPKVPNLAGQKESYVAQQLKDFRDEVRTGSTMPAIANGLSDSEISEMAAFLETLSPCTHLVE